MYVSDSKSKMLCPSRWIQGEMKENSFIMSVTKGVQPLNLSDTTSLHTPE